MLRNRDVNDLIKKCKFYKDSIERDRYIKPWLLTPKHLYKKCWQLERRLLTYNPPTKSENENSKNNIYSYKNIKPRRGAGLKEFFSSDTYMGGNCQNGECVAKMKQELRYPVDNRSLYAQSIYDDQYINGKCTTSQMPPMVEGFGCPSNDTMKQALKWGLILLILYVVVTMLLDLNKKQVVTLDLDTLRMT